MVRTAVVLLNLGAPDKPSAVRPFLKNMFSDPAILSVPGPMRWFLARLISGLRARKAIPIYEQLGGGSPLLPNTEAQAASLERVLGMDSRVFVSMRYWHPMSAACVAAVKRYAPDRIVLLPLYPQFSGTTTGSSFADWRRAAARAGLSAPIHAICCYPRQDGWIGAVADLIRAALAQVGPAGKPRILFSAHGLPKKVIAGGDPYQWQVERTVDAVVAALGDGLDWSICYQSRVGPLEWIGPSTEDEIDRAGRDGVPILVVPIAFVSEHSETLVELDIEYRHRAERAGVPGYIRVPAVATHARFIAGLADLVGAAVTANLPLISAENARICPVNRTGCPCSEAKPS
ncbi:MAG: ferrochelatase [Alphaproteobacteria bacterium]|nr:ferrochelatase [Alphaproteobacteria bacterium]